MGKLTKEKIAAIVKRYDELLSYTEVGKELGVNWITVKRNVEAEKQRKTPKDLDKDSAEVQNTTPVRKEKSKFAQALQLFKDGTQLTGVAIELDLDYDEARKYWKDYCRIAWADYAPRFFSLEDDEQMSLLSLQNRMKNEGMDAKSFALRLKKDFTNLDEVTQKTNQLATKSEELTKEVCLKDQWLKSIKDQARIEQDRLQDLRSENQELLRTIEDNKTEVQKRVKELADAAKQKQKSLSELREIENEIADLLDPNGPKAAPIRDHAEEMLAKLLADDEIMQEVSLVALIEAIRQDSHSRIAFSAYVNSSANSAMLAPMLLPKIVPKLGSLYSRQRQIILHRLRESVIRDYNAQIQGVQISSTMR